MVGMDWSGGRDGGPSRLRFRLGLLIMVTSGLLLVDPTSGQLTTQCVQVGQGRDDGKAFTIGGTKFQCKLAELLATYHTDRLKDFPGYGKKALTDDKAKFDRYIKHGCPYEIVDPDSRPYEFEQNYCSNLIDIRVYAVQQNGKTLRGWLHVEIDLTDEAFKHKKDNSMFYIYSQLRDEHFNAIGEFVMDENEQCKTASPGLIIPSKYQALPCSATGAREHQTAQALFVAKLDAYKNQSAANNYISKENLTRGIHFTWRMSEYWCSRHQRIRIDAWVLTQHGYDAMKDGRKECKKLHCKLQRKITDYWLHPKWFGTADIKTKGGGELDCSKLAVNFSGNGKVHDVVSNWINQKLTKFTMKTDFLNPSLQYDVDGGGINFRTRGCQADPKIDTTFGGRCIHHYEKITSKNVFQTCNYNESAEEFEGINITEVFETEDYETFRVNLKQTRLAMCTQECKVPTTDQDLQEIIANFTYEKVTPLKVTVDLSDLKDSRVTQKRIQIWAARKCHGVVCLIIALFLFPVSNFLSRYYKETFMGTRWYGCAPWFWLHIGACFTMFCIFITGRRSLHSYYGNWGHSTEGEATTHRTLGHLVCFIFLLLSLTGYNRPAHPLFRIIYLFFHALFGFSIYIISIALVITSQNIPMSPSGLGCETNNVPRTGISNTSLVAILWVVFDIVFHLTMTAFQILMDKRTKIVRRGFGFPFMTFLPLEYNRDFRGGLVRKIILGLYVGISFVMTGIAVFDLGDRERKLFKDCGFGEMGCSLEENILGCHQLHRKYVTVINDRYNLTD